MTRDASRPIAAASALLPFALAALAFLLRFPHLDWGLPDVYEEATALRRAWDMAGWGPEREFDPNPRFFRYPSLVLYLHLIGNALGFAVGKATGQWASITELRAAMVADPSPIIVFARGITAVLGAATALFAYRLGRRLGGIGTGIAAALLLAVNAFHVDHSRRVEVDVPLTLFATWALWRIVLALDEPTRRRFAVAGIAVGLASSAKYPGAFLALPLAFALLRAGSARRLSAAIAAALGGALAFALTSPYVFLDFPSFAAEIGSEREHMRVGHFGLEGGISWGWYVRSLARDLAGWPVAVAAGAGVVLAVRRARTGRRSDCAPLVPGLYAIFMLAIVGSWAMKADWYLMPVLPGVLVLAVWGLRELAGLSPRLGRNPRTRRTVFVLGVLLLAAPSLTALPARLAPPPEDPRAAARRWIETNCPAGAFILAEPYGPLLVDATWRLSTEPDLWDAIGERFATRREYAIQHLPMLQVRPETSAPFYDPSLYPDVDLIITSRDISARYRREPERFANQLAFYRSLERAFTRVAEFPPDESVEPEIVVWFNPHQTRPFGYRETVLGPGLLEVPPAELSGQESEFLANLGMNYETFGFFDEAVRAYEGGARYPFPPGRQIEWKLISGLVRCRLAKGDTTGAVEMLGEAADRTSVRGNREAFLEIREKILSGDPGGPARSR
jgi:4-amino-4-deoxy-L-arabinose transferase-like glycosyltransferase